MPDVLAAAFEVKPIGVVRSPRQDLRDDFWGKVDASIVLADHLPEAAFAGLANFRHIKIIFLMHRVYPAKIETGVRHPRERLDWPSVGIFAQRGKARPNCIGLTRGAIQKVEGRTLI